MKKHQEIGVFIGKRVSPHAVAQMTMERGSYLIDMAMDDEPNEIEVIDCYENAQGEDPVCKLSMANSAAALYHRGLDISLTEEDNNSAVTVVLRDGIRTAVNGVANILHSSFGHKYAIAPI